MDIKKATAIFLIIAQFIMAATWTAAVGASFDIISQPSNYTGPVGSTATFHVGAAGNNLTYQWQWYSPRGKIWTNSTSATVGYNTDTLQVVITNARDGFKYRCIVSDAGGESHVSGVATLSVGALFNFISQPSNYTGPVGSTATFHVGATGNNLTYRWQWYSPRGKIWTNSTSATVGYNTDTLSVAVTTARNGFRYRCIVTDASGATVTSNYATLTVEAAPTVYRALVIGNHAYTGGASELKAPDDDAKGIEKMLKEVNGPYSVTVAYNKTASQIKSLINTTFSGAGENDVCVFYYSGHGSPNSCLVGIDNRSYVSPSDLAAALNAVCPNGALIMLDCCYSGGFISANSTTASAAASQMLSLKLQRFNESFVSAFRKIDGKRTVLSGADGIMSTPLTTGKYAILTACTYSQMSTEMVYSDGAGYGIFTKYLLEGLGNEWNSSSSSHSYNSYGGSMPADKNGNSAVTLGELYTYIQTAAETFISDWNTKHPKDTINQDVQYYGTASAVLFER
jgi:hypothetical protein